MAALIKEELDVDTELIPGSKGEFTVWVGETVVARKDLSGFPNEHDVVTAVAKAMPK